MNGREVKFNILVVCNWKIYFSVCISDASLRELGKGETFLRTFSRFFHGTKLMTQEEFEDCASKVYKCCLKSVRDLHELHLRRLIGKKQLIT